MEATRAQPAVDRFIAKAEVLLEALPYMQRFAGKTVVIKYGGHAMTEPKLANGFAEDIVLLKSIGLAPVIVHGGGPQIGEALKKQGITSTFVRGMRVTDAATMEVVEMVLGAKINKTIVGMIHGHGGKAVGLTGKDGRMLVAAKMKVQVREKGKRATYVDVGQVGKIERVNPEILERIVGTDFIPVIAPIGIDEAGNSYNINADLAAAEIAKALGAAKLLLLTDVAGIKDAAGNIQPLVTAAAAKRQIRDGTIAEGMVPKVECSIDALIHGVDQVHIIDGRVSHAVLLEIFTERGVGTEVLLKGAPAVRKPATASKKTSKKAGKKPGRKK
ncbi:MAG: acetylglutamate kinase [Hyphomicrobiaceae bacterium]